MAAFKTLNSQDIIISPLDLVKGFSYEGNALTASDVGIDRYLGNKFATGSATGYLTEYSQSAIYFSTQQLYYSNHTMVLWLSKKKAMKLKKKKAKGRSQDIV